MSIKKNNVIITTAVAVVVVLALAFSISAVYNTSFHVAVHSIIFEISAIASDDSSSTTSTNSTHLLPVLLVHGWNEDASIWGKWEELLKKDGISFYPVTFQKFDDKCGAAVGHATELAEQIQTVKKQTGSDRVNIVAHSKGGIDARVYLADGTKDVSNLVMLGTPNAGSPLADSANICMPATLDIRSGANATKAQMNPNVKYYIIAGDWLHDFGGSPLIPGPDDGLVAVSSVESEKYFQSLGRTSHSHAELLGEQEYNMTRNVLVER
ncbi:lipase family alpha/beta hydrolase [Candidatus Nitrososphaera evergladensis]|nr:alpha/beta fold hydrolase [Candidatus Nitrososphaera evergladensis]